MLRKLLSSLYFSCRSVLFLKSLLLSPLGPLFFKKPLSVPHCPTFLKKWGPLGASNNFFMIMILMSEQNANIWSIKLFSSIAHFKEVTWKHAKLFHYAPPSPIHCNRTPMFELNPEPKILHLNDQTTRLSSPLLPGPWNLTNFQLANSHLFEESIVDTQRDDEWRNCRHW